MPGVWSVGWALCVMLLALPTWAAMADNPVLIQLRGEALVMARTYGLADIAEPGSIDPALKEQLCGVEIGRTPRPGQLTQVTRFEMTALLEKALPGISERLRWGGPVFVRVRGGGTPCDVEALQQSAYQLLLSWLQQRYGQGSAQRVGEPKPVMVPAGNVTFRPKLSATGRLVKRMPVWVDVLVDGEHFQTVPIWFAVSVQAPALVVKGAMKRYQELSPGDVEETILDIASLNDEPLQKSSLPGKRIVHDLEAGAVITAGDVEPMPDVRRGELITVYAHQGAVSLTVKGIALMDGHVSQQITVRNPGNGESYRAVVIGKDQARVN